MQTRSAAKRTAAAVGKGAAGATTARKLPAAGARARRTKPKTKPATAAAAAAATAAPVPPVPSPPPTLESLPEVVHEAIASYMDAAAFARLFHVPNKALRALALPRVTKLELRRPGRSAGLIRLLSKMPALRQLRVTSVRALPGLRKACNEGLCRRVVDLAFKFQGELEDEDELEAWWAIVPALAATHAFPSVVFLSLRYAERYNETPCPQAAISLFKALSTGASPRLRVLDFSFAIDRDGCVEDDELVEAFADMLEQRRELGCRGIAKLPGEWDSLVSSDDADLSERAYKEILRGLEWMTNAHLEGWLSDGDGLHGGRLGFLADCIQEIAEEDEEEGEGVVLPLKEIYAHPPPFPDDPEEEEESLEKLLEVLEDGIAPNIEHLRLCGYRESYNHQPALENLFLNGTLRNLRVLKVDGILAYSFLTAAAGDMEPLVHLKELSVESREDFEDDEEYDDCPEYAPSCGLTQLVMAQAVERNPFPNLERLQFGFSLEGFKAFAAALRAANDEGGSCGQSLKEVKFPVVGYKAVGYKTYTALMADGTMPGLEKIDLSTVENGDAAFGAIVGALEAGDGKRLRKLRFHSASIQSGETLLRLARVLVETDLCPCIQEIDLGDNCFPKEQKVMFLQELRRRWRRIKQGRRNSSTERRNVAPGTLVLDISGVNFW